MNKKKLISVLSISAFAAALPVAMVGIVPTTLPSLKAASQDQHSEKVAITNSSLELIGRYDEDDMTGWSLISKNSGVKAMGIDINDKFSDYALSTYHLINNPGQKGTDNKIMMINSAATSPNSDNFVGQPRNEGYKSNTIKLASNSFYQFQVSMKTAAFDEADPFGSIYISGLEDEEAKQVTLKLEQLSPSNWETYYFYIATGSEPQEISIDLWLGGQGMTSSGVVFFDEIRGIRLSENAYYESIESNSQKKHTIASIPSSAKLVDTRELNFNFEDAITNPNGLEKFEIAARNEKGHARIYKHGAGNYAETTGIEYDPGTDLTINNTQALAMWANDGYVSVKSKPFAIKSMGLYKITARVKTAKLEAGSLTMSVNETDSIINNFSYLKDKYTLGSSTSSAVTTDGSDLFKNGYNEITFYVKGHDRYNSEVELTFNLGKSDELAKGGVSIDNITVETVANDDFKTDGNILTLATATKAESTIKNGSFNDFINNNAELTYPVSANGWTVNNSGSAWSKESGIINIYKPYFDAYDFDWAKNLANPGSSNLEKPGATDDVNNIYMMYNASADYQSISSEKFKLEKNSYNKLSFKYTTRGEASSINVKLTDEFGVLLFEKKGLSAQEWTQFDMLINAGEMASNVTLTISLGDKEDKVSGYAFLDSVALDASTQDTFDKSEGNKSDLSSFMLNLDPTGSITNEMTTSAAFSGKIEAGNAYDAKGGIIKGEGNDAFYYIDKKGHSKPIDDGSLKTNVLAIGTINPSTYSLSSNFKISMEADKYYSLKFRALSVFADLPDKHVHYDKDGNEVEAKYGIKIGMSGMDLIEELSFNDGWSEVEILFKSTSAQESNFTFALVSDCRETTGYAYITDIAWKESTAETYAAAKDDDKFEKTLFLSQTTTTDTEKPDEEEPAPAPADNNIAWLLIPSLIMGAAVIIAVIGWILRKVKFKKNDKLRKEEYDRNEQHLDALATQAKLLQAEELKRTDEQISAIEAKLNEIEEENKLSIAQTREKGEVTKEAERKFKAFASNRAKLTKALEETKEYKAYVETADYLISVEKKILSDNKRAVKAAEKLEKQKRKDLTKSK